MNYWILAHLVATFIIVTRQEEISDCVAGEHYDTTSKSCNHCKTRTYSEDASRNCLSCPGNGRCFCDTTRLEVYAPGGKAAHSYKNCSENGNLRCSLGCYTAATRAHVDPETGSLQNLANILPCKCENPKTRETCQKTQKFARNCFQNECDGGKHYMNSTTNEILSSCYQDYKDKKSCGEAQCDAVRPYIQRLASCNCYHRHGDIVSRRRNCAALNEFYGDLEKNCQVEIGLNFRFIKPLAGSAVIVFLIIAVGLGRYCAVKYGRNLKKSGNLGKMNSYIEWNKIEALGLAGFAIKSEKTANLLSDREIILKARFGVMNGFYGGKFVRSQHVVLKIFSESQCEQHGMELKVINSIFNKSQAKDCNIISVYGPASDSSNRDLVQFLQLLISKSEICKNLVGVIERCYLGKTEDQLITPPRCRYIMMNHCNELSLSKFMSHKECLSPATVLQICRDLAKALDFLHKKNRRGNQHKIIIHCDIKPDNIFVKARLKTSFILGDFGFAVALSPGEVFTLKGSTPSFLPPEWYIMMNHCNELSLSKFMSHKECLSPATVLQICRDLAKALDFLHKKNRRGNQHKIIIHCDIKPDNIFVKARLKTSFILGDFGFAVALSPGEVFTLKGSTPSFLPPEWFVQLRDGVSYSDVQKQNITARANFPCKIDIYQFGLIVWLALHKKSNVWVDEFQKIKSTNPKIKKHEFLHEMFSNHETYSTRPSFATNANPLYGKLRNLAQICWQTHVQHRPSAGEILAILSDKDEAVTQV
ncbi:uncharacterized protein LOC134826848 [Bolinopsis microptera]|uniref:uncharacterized protein LOC134826848 n=1 Tax=Bolinopsis microptera TaxID=2820187 RepID=UPI0030793623